MFINIIYVAIHNKIISHWVVFSIHKIICTHFIYRVIAILRSLLCTYEYLSLFHDVKHFIIECVSSYYRLYMCNITVLYGCIKTKFKYHLFYGNFKLVVISSVVLFLYFNQENCSNGLYSYTELDVFTWI